jgi:hypothetical protein
MLAVEDGVRRVLAASTLMFYRSVHLLDGSLGVELHQSLFSVERVIDTI